MLTLASKPDPMSRPLSAPCKVAICCSSFSAYSELPSSSRDPVDPTGRICCCSSFRYSSRNSFVVARDRKSFDEKSTEPGGLDLSVRSFDCDCLRLSDVASVCSNEVLGDFCRIPFLVVMVRRVVVSIGWWTRVYNRRLLRFSLAWLKLKSSSREADGGW